MYRDGDDDADDEGRSLSRPDDELLAPSTGQEHTINHKPSETHNTDQNCLNTEHLNMTFEKLF